MPVNSDKSRRRPVLLGEYEVAIDGRTIPYLLKCSDRAKHLWLSVRQGTGLVVTVPRSYNIERLPAFLVSHRRWLMGALARYCQPQPDKPVIDSIPYLGNYLKLVQEKSESGVCQIRLEENRLIVSLDSNAKNLISELEKWYRSQAEKLIREKVARLSKAMGLSFSRITIRGQRTRWASCSFQKNLSFNWKLILIPEPVIDYVIVHELCHLKEMNHGDKFWKLVSRVSPIWREHRKWLSEHGTELTRGLG